MLIPSSRSNSGAISANISPSAANRLGALESDTIPCTGAQASPCGPSIEFSGGKGTARITRAMVFSISRPAWSAAILRAVSRSA